MTLWQRRPVYGGAACFPLSVPHMPLDQPLKRHLTIIPWIVAGLCVLECLAFMLYHHATTGYWAFYMPDTNSYIFDGFTLRPPFYPLFLRACGFSTDMTEPTMIAVSLVPIIVHVLSVAAFTRMAIGVGGIWGLCVALVYALFPSLGILPLEMGTESFSMSFVVITTYLFYCMLYEPSYGLWIAFTLMILLLQSIKPAFLFVPVCVAVIGIGMMLMPVDPHRRILSRRLLVSAAVCVAYILVYSAGVYYKWGVFTPSTVSLRNDYYEARLAGVLDPKCSPDADLAAVIDSYITNRPVIDEVDSSAWIEGLDLTNKYDLAALRVTIIESRKKHAAKWRDYFVRKVSLGLSESLIYPGTDKGVFAGYEFRDDIGRFLTRTGVTWWIPTAVALAMMSLLTLRFAVCLRHRAGCKKARYGAVGIFADFRCKSLRASSNLRAWCLASFLALLLVGNIGVVVFGAPYDFSRLLCPVLPAFFLLLGCLPGLFVHSNDKSA